MKKYYFLSTLLFCFCLLGDELTDDPPLIWESNCQPCKPTLPLPLACPPAEPLLDKVTVDLVNPIYENGVLTTIEGGILYAPNLRIQAKNIVYTRKLNSECPAFSVYCEGDLLIDYQDKVLLGQSFYYDFLTNTGILVGGRVALFPWFLSGEEVQLLENGDLCITNGMITTSEGGENQVVVTAKQIGVIQNHIVTAEDVFFRVKELPLFWLPKFKLDLDVGRDIPFAVNFGWNGYLGTHAGIRYQFLSLGEFKGYGRLDGYLGRGLGVGVETEYDPKYSCEQFFTRSYFAHDLSLDDPEKKDRYRFQGMYYNRFFNNSTSVDLIYDAVSDAQMAKDYQTDDFELNPAQETRLKIRHLTSWTISNFLTRVRVNSFQNVNQELPTFEMNFHPLNLFDSGIIFDNFLEASYLNYVFSKDVFIRDNFDAARFEVHPRVYRPFHWGPVNITPEAGLITIFYSDSPNGQSVGQLVGDLHLHLQTQLSRNFSGFKHLIIPHADYQFLTDPRVHVDRAFIFTINDAYAPLQILKFGVRQGLFFENLFASPLWIDIFSNAFLEKQTSIQMIQKGYLNAELSPLNCLFLRFESGYNFQERLIDFYNAKVEWAVNENLAFKAEYLHRSRFDWRKADFYNFLLEATREQELLLDSALSDQRDTLLARISYRFNPDLRARFEIRHGWNRIDQPHYTEYLIGVEHRLFDHWKVRFTFEKRMSDARCYVTLKLDKGPPAPGKWCCF